MKTMSVLIERLEIVSTQKQLPGIQDGDEITISNSDVGRLLGYSSILSLSERSKEKALAYEIVTRLLELNSELKDSITTSAEVIFSRLGNFPGRDLLRERFFTSEGQVPNFLRLECISREAENSIFIEQEKPIKLTDFQYQFFNSMQEERSLSISAPTSAGKSFVLGLNLVKKLKKRSSQCIVYVVPTRALITEVSTRIRDALRINALENVIIRTAPFPVSNERLRNSIIYVLTQERLMSLLTNEVDDIPAVTSLIVDEAHEIQKGKRGILLQNAIDFLLKKFPGTEVLFASPLIKNPGYFLNVFDRLDNGRFFTETVSPVSQNILLVSEVARAPNKIKIELLSQEQRVDIGIRNIDFKFRGKKALQKAHFAKSVAKNNESAIVFSNGPADAESVASELAKITTGFKPSDNVIAFIDFLKKEIHPEYALIECLAHGIGFHYGKMPSIVRAGVESLFKNDEILHICCTSTLLQGVNLPAKHIIIENPKSGDKPMNRSDFQNLSGRAGRLLKEFHGNVWCIRPGAWDEHSYQGERLQEITSAISSVMSDGGTIIQKLLNDSISNKHDIDKAEMAFSKLYQDYHISNDQKSIEAYRTESNSQSLDETIAIISKVEVNIPVDILEKNKSIRPDHLQANYDHLKKEENIYNCIPLNPFSKGAKERMESIIDIFIECYEWEITPPYKRLISYLAYNWMWGKPLGELLAARVSYVRENPPKKGTPKQDASTIIREYLGTLDHEVRFKLVKYFSAYIDVLKHVLLTKNISLDKEIEPYHVYLEFGSCDKKALNVMAMGLSRFTALHLSKLIHVDDISSNVDDYYEIIKKIPIENASMPYICKQEIYRILGRGG
ncbi:DEAD/DEAH box helicase [Aeromonas veronii]|nr:DEAD/DEAH box helicase [Aeromonas veronii]